MIPMRATRTAVRALSVVAPRATSALVTGVFMLPRRHDRPAREQELIARATPLRFSTRHGDVAAWTWGRGPTVMLIHGWEGRGTQLGAFIDPLVSAGYRVLAWDMPAHGASRGRLTNAMEFAEVIGDVTRHVGDPAAIIAHSMGALSVTIALRLGAIHAGRIAYVAPATAPEKGIELVREHLGVPDAVLDRVKDRLLSRLGITWDDLMHGAVPDGMAIPLFVMHDRGDRDVDPANAERITSRWQGAELRWTTGLGHNRILRDPEVVRAVTGFLINGHPPAP